jgi:N-acetylglucosaminyl-diphospho-decaprenol L-rhamnosyltransferase
MSDLAVIIVTWNVRELALTALHSLLDDLSRTDLRADVYVVDSASTDGTAEAIAANFPQVYLIACEENLGFVKANNLAMRRIGFGTLDAVDLPKAVYLLNPDTITQTGATQALLQALMENPTCGLVGARLTYGDGSFQHSAFAFPGLCQLWVEFFPIPGRLIESPFNGRYPRALYESGHPFPVDFVLGATMVLRSEVVQSVGLLDEYFFMYCEEVDWAWRIHKAGWNVSCVPAAHVIHLAGQSTTQVRPQAITYLWTSRLHLFAKHYPRWKYSIARWIIRLGIQRKMRLARRTLPTAKLEPVLNAYQTIYDRLSGHA